MKTQEPFPVFTGFPCAANAYTGATALRAGFISLKKDEWWKEEFPDAVGPRQAMVRLFQKLQSFSVKNGRTFDTNLQSRKMKCIKNNFFLAPVLSNHLFENGSVPDQLVDTVSCLIEKGTVVRQPELDYNQESNNEPIVLKGLAFQTVMKDADNVIEKLRLGEISIEFSYTMYGFPEESLMVIICYTSIAEWNDIFSRGINLQKLLWFFQRCERILPEACVLMVKQIDKFVSDGCHILEPEARCNASGVRTIDARQLNIFMPLHFSWHTYLGVKNDADFPVFYGLKEGTNHPSGRDVYSFLNVVGNKALPPNTSRIVKDMIHIAGARSKATAKARLWYNAIEKVFGKPNSTIHPMPTDHDPLAVWELADDPEKLSEIITNFGSEWKKLKDAPCTDMDGRMFLEMVKNNPKLEKFGCLSLHYAKRNPPYDKGGKEESVPKGEQMYIIWWMEPGDDVFNSHFVGVTTCIHDLALLNHIVIENRMDKLHTPYFQLDSCGCSKIVNSEAPPPKSELWIAAVFAGHFVSVFKNVLAGLLKGGAAQGSGIV